VTKEEMLQKFESVFDYATFELDFPDVSWAASELEDGQQEIIVRLQGIDPGFHPSVDIAAIETMAVDQITDFTVKNPVTLKKQIRKDKEARLCERDVAIDKRIDALLNAAGLTFAEYSKSYVARKMRGGVA